MRRAARPSTEVSGTWPPHRPATPRLSPVPEPWAFAVEDTTVQLTWRALAPGPVVVEVGGRRRTTTSTGGPGSTVIDDLAPATAHELVVTDAAGTRRVVPATTLPPLPGPERFRFAPLSDLHLPSRVFGFWGTMQEQPHPPVSSSERAARAALGEAVAWGAQLVVLKGDLTHRSHPEDWDAVARLVQACPVPVLAIPGNHDTKGSPGGLDPDEQLTALGVPVGRPVLIHDVPGLRIVLADTTRSGVDRGRLHHVTDLVLAAVDGAGPCLVATHHQLQPLPLPVSWPPGIASHHGDPLLTRLAQVNPATLVTSGHTHRNRRRQVGPIVTTEVGSPKDFPGGWAGYVAHDDGIRQVVRRVSDPDVLAWTDRTARAALGLWGRWSPGPLGHRCFVHRWPS